MTPTGGVIPDPERKPTRERSWARRLFGRRPEDRTRFRPERSSLSRAPALESKAPATSLLSAAAVSSLENSKQLQGSRRRKSSRVVVGSLLGLFLLGTSAATLVAFAPSLVDRFGYEPYYSRIEPDGRRFLLERKRAEWLPGGELRCVVVDREGTRRTFEVAEVDEPEAGELTPEKRIQTALRGKVDAGTQLED